MARLETITAVHPAPACISFLSQRWLADEAKVRMPALAALFRDLTPSTPAMALDL
jgi:hypothetical protein